MQQIMFIEGMKPLEEVPFTNREGKADVLIEVIMQQIMFIEGMKPLEEVPFTNREGKADVLPKQEFVLSDGINTIVAETVGNYQRRAKPLSRRR